MNASILTIKICRSYRSLLMFFLSRQGNTKFWQWQIKETSNLQLNYNTYILRNIREIPRINHIRKQRVKISRYQSTALLSELYIYFATFFYVTNGRPFTSKCRDKSQLYRERIKNRRNSPANSSEISFVGFVSRKIELARLPALPALPAHSYRRRRIDYTRGEQET